MTTRFADQLARAQTAIDDTFGERLSLVPWQGGRYTAGGGLDQNRPVKMVIGTFAQSLGTMTSSGDDPGSRASFRGEAMPTSAPRASITLAQFASPDEWPRDGDHVVRVDAPMQPVYRIVGPPVSDDEVRIYLTLVKT